MGALMRAHDWAAKPMGTLESWPAPLKIAVLNSPILGAVLWGPDLLMFYNDAYIPSMADRHPGALGRRVSEVWCAAWEQVSPPFYEAMNNGVGFSNSKVELVITRRGKVETTYWDFSAAPIRDEDGAIVELLNQGTEITSAYNTRLSLEVARRRESDRAQRDVIERDRIFEISRDLMAVATFDGYLKSINPAWAKALDRSEAELLSKPFADVIHPDDLAVTVDVVAALQSGQPVRQFLVRLLKSNGEPIAYAWSAAPDAVLENGIFYTVGRDITDETAAAAELLDVQAALRQSQKMEAVGQLTGGIAHDFNNLLAGISGSLELLQKRLVEGRLGGAERYIDAAQSSARRAAALTQRLLAFSRRQTLDPRPTDVNKLIQGMEELIRRSVGPTVELEVVGAGGLWLTQVDPSQLENALLNLCINGRDSMAPDGGRLTIETSNKWLDERAAKARELPPGQYVSACVTDTGTGMTAEVIERAFEPFYTTKPLGQGTGLGLSMIYGFVRQSGGQVRIYSEAGKGTSMCLYLPRYAGGLLPAEDDAPADAIEGANGCGETVLVVDDEDTIRMLIVEVLDELGFQAIEAADGPSA